MGAPMMPRPMNPIFLIFRNLRRYLPVGLHMAISLAHSQRSSAGRLGSNFQPGMRYCMATASSRAPSPCCLVELVGLLHFGHVEFDAQARLLRHLRPGRRRSGTAPRQALAVLPDPVRVDRGHAARRRGGDMGEHRQRHVEVVVRMRAPGQAPVAAGLRHAHRAGHGPEVRVGQRNVDRLQRERVARVGASRSPPCWSPWAGRWRGGIPPSLHARRIRLRRRTDLRRRPPRRACRASGGLRP